MMKNLCTLIFTSSFLFSCIKKECKPDSYLVYRWEIPVTLSPAKDTFNIGDTITITSRFQDMVKERFYGNKYKLVDYTFKPVSTLIRLDSIQNYAGFRSDFSEVQVIVPNWVNYDFTPHVMAMRYRYESNQYALEFQIVLKKKGVFLFKLESWLGAGPEQEFTGRCDNFMSTAAMTLNNGAVNNIDMLYDATPTSQGDLILRGPKPEFYDKAGYCFSVK